MNGKSCARRPREWLRHTHYIIYILLAYTPAPYTVSKKIAIKIPRE